MITENLSTLKIHKLTQEQYDRELAAGRIDPDAIYLTPDSNNSGIHVDDEAPANAPDGSLWVDMDEDSSGSEGASGYTPVRGVDYWTEADKAEIKSYVDSAILGGAW